MANELGPLSAQKRIVVFNPDNLTQVRQVSGGGSPQWVSVGSATFAQCTVAMTATGAFWYAGLPTGLDAGRVYPLALYATGSTAFSDSSLAGEYFPEAATSVQAVEILAAVQTGGAGSGDISVNQNTGGTDNLRYVDGNGNGIVADVFAYLTSEYTANSLTAPVRGKSKTGSDGRWLVDMMLSAGDYTFTYIAPGWQLATKEQTVS